MIEQYAGEVKINAVLYKHVKPVHTSTPHDRNNSIPLYNGSVYISPPRIQVQVSHTCILSARFLVDNRLNLAKINNRNTGRSVMKLQNVSYRF